MAAEILCPAERRNRRNCPGVPDVRESGWTGYIFQYECRIRVPFGYSASVLDHDQSLRDTKKGFQTGIGFQIHLENEKPNANMVSRIFRQLFLSSGLYAHAQIKLPFCQVKVLGFVRYPVLFPEGP